MVSKSRIQAVFGMQLPNQFPAAVDAGFKKDGLQMILYRVRGYKQGLSHLFGGKAAQDSADDFVLSLRQTQRIRDYRQHIRCMGRLLGYG